MKMIQSNNNQCIAAAFAMVFGCTLDEMLKALGHTGLERICDEEPPYCYRGFHPAEFVTLCLTRGFAMTMIEKCPAMMHGHTLVDHTPLIGDRFYDFFNLNAGVVLGSLNFGYKTIGHAVAWDVSTRKVFDPRGLTYELPFNGFEPRQFFLIQRVCSHEGREGL